MLSAREQLKVRYAETAQMGIVYYSRYFEYFEIGRLRLSRACGFPYNEMESKHNCYLPVVETHAKFYHSAKLEDDLTIETKILERPSAILKFDYEIFREETLIAKGYTTHVFLNSKIGKPGRPPVRLKELFDKKFPEKMLSQLLINGIIAGSIYALIALGFTVIYRTVKFFHFAHGGLAKRDIIKL